MSDTTGDTGERNGATERKEERAGLVSRGGNLAEERRGRGGARPMEEEACGTGYSTMASWDLASGPRLEGRHLWCGRRCEFSGTIIHTRFQL